MTNLLVGLRLGCLLGNIETIVVLMRIPINKPRVVFEGTSIFFGHSIWYRWRFLNSGGAILSHRPQSPWLQLPSLGLSCTTTEGVWNHADFVSHISPRLKAVADIDHPQLLLTPTTKRYDSPLEGDPVTGDLVLARWAQQSCSGSTNIGFDSDSSGGFKSACCICTNIDIQTYVYRWYIYIWYTCVYIYI